MHDQWSFFANEHPPSNGLAPSILRVAVNVQTRAVTVERVCAGRKAGVKEWMRVGAGRAYVAQDGGCVSASLVSVAGDVSPGAARAWREAAGFEHASVASFSRGTLELMALGAPLHLVERMHAAAKDEVRHARLSLAIARRLERGTTGPLVVDESLDAAFGPLPALPVRSNSFATVAVDTLLEAAVPETLGAFAAEVAARACRDEAVAGVVAEIAADEARHAALAWDIVQWCVEQSENARAAVITAVSALAAPATSPSHGTSDDMGLLSPDSEVRAWSVAFEQRVQPRLRALLGELQRGGAVA